MNVIRSMWQMCVCVDSYRYSSELVDLSSIVRSTRAFLVALLEIDHCAAFHNYENLWCTCVIRTVEKHQVST